jgi:Uma2 family endonuclease
MGAARKRNGYLARRGDAEIFYPESDGKPMAETDEHLDQMLYLVAALKLWFAKRRRVYVAGNNLVYYVKGDTRQRVSPDVYIVKGIEKRKRRVYKLWEERKSPCVAIEISSKGTRREDLVTKFRLYRDVLRVKEYYIFDPLREYLPGRLKAWGLVRGNYVERPIDGDRILSPELGLYLVERGTLRLLDPRTNQELRTLEESEEERKREAEGRKREAEGRKREAEGRKRAEEALRRAESERDALQAEIERLRRSR